ncbi:MAG: hypothetical protein QOG63_1217 [Thermoleophilaceae bacterium]|nr:hypothetical protein [Thermoleophilaceae bacterium]
MHAVLRRLWPGRFGSEPLPEHASLGEGGLQLDSIEVVELLLECEERAGRPTSGTVELLEAGPITLGQLIDHLNGA